METKNKCGTDTVIVSNKEIKKEKSPNKKDNIQKITYKKLILKPEKRVTFTEDTIDNEHMNKKKSKSFYIFYY